MNELNSVYRIDPHPAPGARRVFFGTRKSDGKPVAIKSVGAAYPSADDLAALQHEFTVLSRLQGAPVARPLDLLRQGNGVALVLERAAGEPLDRMLAGQRVEAKRFVSLALAMVGSLQAVHARGVLHRNIEPAHFFVAGPRATLIDFGLATEWGSERHTPGPPERLEGTLSYISPEQTGRTNRSVDRRGDLYSLGAAFYQMLTGRLPFETASALELLHSHIARTPVAPHAACSHVPPVLSDIVMRLLRKSPEERYQTAAGLRADLECVGSQLTSHGVAASFELGTRDQDGELRVPETLYGREAETQALLSAFERVQNGACELNLIAGAAGIGKSALVREIHPALVRGGHFVAGKFDQYARGIPYSALSSACGSLVRVFLTATAAELEAWRHRVATALGDNLSVLTDFVPELKFVFDELAPISSLTPSSAQKRFERSILRFLEASASAAAPLVVFLDDLQWADSASIELLERIVSSSQQRHLLVIGSYREEEVDAVHPLRACLERLKSRVRIERIELHPLGIHDVRRMVADTLRRSRRSTEDLADRVAAKTSGNPFFVAHFLTKLSEEGHLLFDPEAGFDWDIDVIARLPATDNVVELVVSRLSTLERRAQQLLALASCIGHTFRLSTLATIAGSSRCDVAAALRSAVQHGFLATPDPRHRLLQTLLEGKDGEQVDVRYRFTHDRVQQAAHATLAGEERTLVHWNIGRLLLEQHPEGAPADEALFEIVQQGNLGLMHIASDAERMRWAQLNLHAAQRALSAMAHATALELAGTCLSLLGGEPWQREHNACLAAHQVVAEAHFLLGRYEPAFEAIEAIELHATAVLERVPARNLKATLLSNQMRLQEASTISLGTLQLLGVTLPDPLDSAALRDAVRATFGEYQKALGTRSVASLAAVPAMADACTLALVDTLAAAIPAAFQWKPDLMALLALRAVQLPLEHGMAPLSPFFFAQYSVVHSRVTNDLARAYEFGQLGLALAGRPGYEASRGAAHFVVGAFLTAWLKPFKESIDHLERGITAGLDAGDALHAFFCMTFSAQHRLYAGEPLATVARLIAGYREVLEASDDVVNLMFLTVTERTVATLLGRTQEPGSSVGERLLQEVVGKSEPSTVAALYGNHQAMVRYLLGDAQGSLRASEECTTLPAAQEAQGVAELAFYHGMACASLAASAEGERRAELVAKLDKDLATYEPWAASCPHNFGARCELLRAESLALRRRSEEALDAFERAIEQATKATALHHLAIAYERCAHFHQARCRSRLANACAGDAAYHYERWGAPVLVARVRAQFPQSGHLATVERPRAAGAIPRQGGAAGTRTAEHAHLDLASAMHVAEAMASELRLEPLVRRLMELLVESAGATHGSLILPQGEGLVVRAALDIEPQSTEANLEEPLELSTRVVPAVVQYCVRSREAVFLDDAQGDALFGRDPVVLQRQCRSVACMPLLHQGRLAGVLYLENESGPGFFHAGRVERLQFLGGHAAVALENARLYDALAESNASLDRRVVERTAELSSRNADMRHVLDNVAQGLLTIDLEGRLASERSAVVDEWFGPFEPGASFLDYASALDPGYADMFAVALELLTDDFLPEELALEQLPTKLRHAGRDYRLVYEAIRSGAVLKGLLLVVDDVTEALRQAQEDAQQKQQLAVFRQFARDRGGLLTFFDEGEALVQQLQQEEASAESLRGPLHTLKGNAGLLTFDALAERCHAVEDAIEEGLCRSGPLQRLAAAWHDLKQTLELLLGDGARDRVEVRREDLEGLLRELRQGASTSQVVSELERWQLGALARPLGRLAEHARGLARRLGKGELEVLIDDGGLLADEARGAPFWSSVVHLVRNAVDHGLETPEQRSACGKASAAQLELRASCVEGELLLEVIDDGRGIDWEALRGQACSRGLPSQSQEDLEQALFRPQLSTRAVVSATSGRGVGLAEVRREVERQGGRISVHSEPGAGCRWVIALPASAVGVRPSAPRSTTRLSLAPEAAHRHTG